MMDPHACALIGQFGRCAAPKRGIHSRLGAALRREWIPGFGPPLDRPTDLPIVFAFRVARLGGCAAKTAVFAPPAMPQAFPEHPLGEAEPAFYPTKALTDAVTIASP